MLSWAHQAIAHCWISRMGVQLLSAPHAYGSFWQPCSSRHLLFLAPNLASLLAELVHLALCNQLALVEPSNLSVALVSWRVGTAAHVVRTGRSRSLIMVAVARARLDDSGRTQLRKQQETATGSKRRRTKTAAGDKMARTFLSYFLLLVLCRSLRR